MFSERVCGWELWEWGIEAMMNGDGNGNCVEESERKGDSRRRAVHGYDFRSLCVAILSWRGPGQVQKHGTITIIQFGTPFK